MTTGFLDKLHSRDEFLQTARPNWRRSLSRSGASPSYLTCYKQTWYFRVAVPSDLRPTLGMTEIRISLRTGYLRPARVGAMKLAGKAHSLFADLRQGGRMAKELSRDDLRQVALKWLRAQLDEDQEGAVLFGPITEVGRDEAVDILAKKITGAERELGLNRLDRIRGEILPTLEEMGIEVGQVDPATEDLLCLELLKADLKRALINLNRIQGNHDYEVDYFASLAQTGLALSPVAVRPQAAPLQVASQPLLSVLVGSYIQDKRRERSWRPSSEKNIIPALSLFVEVVGDQPVNELTHEAIRGFRSFIRDHYPVRCKITPRYKKMSIAQLKQAPIPEKDRLSDARINFYFSYVSGFFKWAEAQGYKFETGFPAILTHKITTPAQEQRDYFTDEDLHSIFYSPFFQEARLKKAHQLWVPMIGLFTGMRLSEICLLKVEDLAEEDGVWSLLIHEHEEEGVQTKTAAGRRVVPVHPFLMDDLGLPGFVAKMKRRGEKRLFPDLTLSGGVYYRKVSRWFNEQVLKETGLKKKSGKLDFHSFRHTFVNHCKLKDVLEGKVADLVGHSTSDGKASITFNRYGKKYPPQVLYQDVVLKVDYGVDLSHLVRSRWCG